MAFEEWFDCFPMLQGGIPSIETIWAVAQECVRHGDTKRAKRFESLIYLLHNSVVPCGCGINETTHFAYGGIGVVIHKEAEFGKYVMVGQGVTIGGNPGRFRLNGNGKRCYTPKIGSHVYLSAGCRLLGGVEIGDCVVVGANSVVTRDVPPFSIVAGAPARVIRSLDANNVLGAKALFLAAKTMTNEEFLAFFNEKRERFLETKANLSGDSLPAKQTQKEHFQTTSTEAVAALQHNNSQSKHIQPRRSLCAKRLEELRNSKFADEGRAILETGKWTVAGHPPYNLSVDLDWEGNPFDSRTWLWALHQFKFLPMLLAHAANLGDSDAVQFACALVQSWSSRFLDDRSFGAAWHDHGTALRARNVLLLRHYLIENPIIEAANLAYLEQFLRRHIEVLGEEGFYSRSTNHGLDQSLVLLELIMELDERERMQDLLDVACERIKHEVSHAFAEDGGHVENSPAYLNYGLKQAIEASETCRFYFEGSRQIGLDSDLMDRAVLALAFMTKPDRSLPMIGDTSHFIVKDFLASNLLPSYPFFRYAVTSGKGGTPFKEQSLVLRASGWAVIRSRAERSNYADSVHLVFKCGFLSTYHRHDDDLSFVLYAFREDWLIDGGLYKHDPKDPLRVYARSAEAHNLSMPFRARATRVLDHSRNEWGIEDSFDDGRTCRISARSGMFIGFDSRRIITVDRETNSIHIVDAITCVTKTAREQMNGRVDVKGSTYVTRFLAPADKLIRIDRAIGQVRAVGKTHCMTIRCNSSSVKIVVRTGEKEPTPAGWASIQAGTMVPAHAIEFHHSTANLRAEFDISFVDHAADANG